MFPIFALCCGPVLLWEGSEEINLSVYEYSEKYQGLYGLMEIDLDVPIPKDYLFKSLDAVLAKNKRSINKKLRGDGKAILAESVAS